MKLFLLIFLLLPSLSFANDELNFLWKRTSESCHSFFVTECYEDYSDDLVYYWWVYQTFEEEVATTYLLEHRLYEKGTLLSEPVHWNYSNNPELWNKKYWPILNAIKFPY